MPFKRGTMLGKNDISAEVGRQLTGPDPDSGHQQAIRIRQKTKWRKLEQTF